MQQFLVIFLCYLCLGVFAHEEDKNHLSGVTRGTNGTNGTSAEICVKKQLISALNETSYTIAELDVIAENLLYKYVTTKVKVSNNISFAENYLKKAKDEARLSGYDVSKCNNENSTLENISANFTQITQTYINETIDIINANYQAFTNHRDDYVAIKNSLIGQLANCVNYTNVDDCLNQVFLSCNATLGLVEKLKERAHAYALNNGTELVEQIKNKLDTDFEKVAANISDVITASEKCYFSDNGNGNSTNPCVQITVHIGTVNIEKFYVNN